MRKKITAILCTAAVLLSMTACSGTETSDGKPSADNSSSAVSDSSQTSSEEQSVSSEESKGGEYVKYELNGEVTPNMIEKSRLNEGNKVRLANVIKKLKAGENITVAFIGGSITQGVSAGNELCYAKLTSNWLQDTYPDAKVNYVNAGIGATGSYIGVHRAGSDVLSKNPDLVFAEFSVNDTVQNTERDKESYDSLLRTLWLSETKPAIVTIATTQEDGTSFQQYHEEIIKKYDIPMISYRNAILDVIEHGDIEWKDISNDNIHPNEPGHKIISQLIASYFTDIAAGLDSISGEESNFSEAATAAGYVNGKLLMTADANPVVSGFIEREGDFGGFSGQWLAKTSDGLFNGASLTFETEAKNIGILYAKYTNKGGTANVYIDDELVTTLNADFTNGWGNYVECANIKTFETSGKHTVKIVPVDAEGSAQIFGVTALAVS